MHVCRGRAEYEAVHNRTFWQFLKFLVKRIGAISLYALAEDLCVVVSITPTHRGPY